MTGGYVIIAGILLYIFLLQKDMSPLRSAAILVGGYWVLSSIVASMLYASWGIPIAPNLFSLTNNVTTLVQLVVAVGIFDRVGRSGDEYLSYAFWAGLGLALIFFVIPNLVNQLL